MTTVKQILDQKGHKVWDVSPEDLIIDALQLMAEKNVGALLVIDRGQVVGVISERDYARKVDLVGKNASNTRVREIMTRDVIYIEPNQTVEGCMALMTNKRIRHLPVLEAGMLVGVISIGDIVKAVISDKEFMIEQLESYITGG
jgi:CBS domain-containing protein